MLKVKLTIQYLVFVNDKVIIDVRLYNNPISSINSVLSVIAFHSIIKKTYNKILYRLDEIWKYHTNCKKHINNYYPAIYRLSKLLNSFMERKYED